MKTKIEAETRPNGRGGFEIGLPGMPVGSGQGNYPTEADAFAVAAYNYDRKSIKRHEEPARAVTATIKKTKPLGIARARRAHA